MAGVAEVRLLVEDGACATFAVWEVRCDDRKARRTMGLEFLDL